MKQGLLNSITPILTSLLTLAYSANVNSAPCLSILDYTTPSDTIFDDTGFATAITAAQIEGSAICLPAGNYKFNNTLVIPAGIQFRGAGTGDDPLQASNLTGSVLEYYGNDWAVKMNGSGAGLSDVLIYDASSNNAVGGVSVEADGVLVESSKMSNVLIFGFDQGEGMRLYAINDGGIAYNSFYDIRIRHANTGIHIQEEKINDDTFINSNKFIHGVVSGGGYDYGIRINGGNNNTFDGMVIEPPFSNIGHLVVTKGEFVGKEIRIEALQQQDGVPVVLFENGTRGSRVDGTFAGGLIKDFGDNDFALASHKNISVLNDGSNQFSNAAFSGVSGSSIPAWTLSGSPVITEGDAEILANHKVLSISGATELKPTAALKALAGSRLHSTVSFGIYAKTNVPNAVKTIFTTPNDSTVSSTAHPGDGQWHFVGMRAHVTRPATGSMDISPVILLDSANVELTTPTFTFGSERPSLHSASLPQLGGTLYGQLSHAVREIDGQSYLDDGIKRLVLPTSGNVFIADLSSLAIDPLPIQRINDLTADRFLKGSVVTLVFENNVTISSSAYINLSSTYSGKGSLQLLSLGNGTWIELSRTSLQ